jgi:hypothetical protein
MLQKSIVHTPTLALTNGSVAGMLAHSWLTEGLSMTPKEKASKITAKWLRENMAYDAETGRFWWIKPGFGRTVGKRIGGKQDNGNNYLAMKINNTIFYAHRLAWLHHYGSWPDGLLDHIDGDRTNNAIGNLRVATSSQNAARRPSRRMIAPSRGVFPHAAGYVARIYHGNKRHYLGYFPTAEAARMAYEEAAKKIHGEFAHPGARSAKKRGDFLNNPTCEMCGKQGKWGADSIRHDTTRMGKIRGTLCRECHSVIFLCDHDKKKLQHLYRTAMEYIDNLDIFDSDESRFDASAPYVSVFDLARRKEQASDG